MKTTLVIPAHNEEEIIADTIKSIEKEVVLDYEIIVVNDHSSDNTAVIIKGLMQHYSNIKLIDNENYR